MLNIFAYLLLMKFCTCIKEKSIESTKSPPDFRKKVEEITAEKSMHSDDANSNLVSFLMKNVKEIFGELNESEETTVVTLPDNDKTTLVLRKTVATPPNIDERMINFDTNTDEKGLTFNTVTYKTKSTDSSKTSSDTQNLLKLTTLSKSVLDLRKKIELLNLSKDLAILQKAEQIERESDALDTIDPLVINNTILERGMSSRSRSCIFCNNVQVMECYDLNHIVKPSTICELEEDICYTQHTPFGIVDRGCFNVNNNLTTYVCSCNLCNYIAISEMPYLFSTKRDWIDNVIELSRTRRLRNSVLKDMSCLRCEVNTSTKTGDSANCLEGNVGTLPIQECADNEICGVKAIRSEGYVWRGCVTKPLYNYWWTLCDTDLCNFDSPVSVYDEL